MDTVAPGLKKRIDLIMELPTIRVEGRIRGGMDVFEDHRLDRGAESPEPPRRASMDRSNGGRAGATGTRESRGRRVGNHRRGRR